MEGHKFRLGVVLSASPDFCAVSLYCVLLTHGLGLRFLQRLGWIQVEHGMPGAWLVLKLVT